MEPVAFLQKRIHGGCILVTEHSGLVLAHQSAVRNLEVLGQKRAAATKKRLTLSVSGHDNGNFGTERSQLAAV